MAIDATTLNDIVLAEHLIGSRLYSQLTTPTSDYDWMRVIAGPNILVRGTPASMVIRALTVGFGEFAHTNLCIPDNFFRVQHTLWQELKANRKSFLTEETLKRIRANFLVNLSVIKNGTPSNKHKAELLRRGWRLLELITTQSINITLTDTQVTLLQNLRLSGINIPEAYRLDVDQQQLASEVLSVANELELNLNNATLNPSTEVFDYAKWLEQVESLTV
jgi:hypothetical protein